MMGSKWSPRSPSILIHVALHLFVEAACAEGEVDAAGMDMDKLAQMTLSLLCFLSLSFSLCFLYTSSHTQ